MKTQENLGKFLKIHENSSKSTVFHRFSSRTRRFSSFYVTFPESKSFREAYWEASHRRFQRPKAPRVRSTKEAELEAKVAEAGA